MPGTARRARGYTLIEMLVAATIVVIVATLAVPAYRDYRLKAGRGVGASCLVEAEQRLGLHYGRTNLGPPAVTLADVGLSSDCRDDPPYRLQIEAESRCTGRESPGHYALRASPQGAQAEDGDLVLCVSPSLANPSERLDRQHTRPGAPDLLLPGWTFRPGR